MSKTVNIEVVARNGEPADRLIKRFLKKIKKENLMEELNSHTYYEKPSEKRQKKKKEKARVLNKLQEDQNQGKKKKKSKKGGK